MEKILIYFFMGISLSMDAFSLALSLGTTLPNKKEIQKTSLAVGIFHFFMPLIGNRIGKIFQKHLLGKANVLTSIIFLFLAIEMFINRNKEDEEQTLTIATILLIAFTVSIDSLTVGFAFGLTNEIILLASTIFMIVTAVITYIGFYLGKKMRNQYKKGAVYIGILIMLFISLKYLLS